MPEAGFFTSEQAQIIWQEITRLRSLRGVASPGASSAPGDTPIYVKNSASEEIPAYGLMQSTGTTEQGGQNFITVNQYDQDEEGELLVNGPRAIEASGGRGIAQKGPVYRILTDGSPVSAGDLWGPVDGSWEATDEGWNFKGIGSDDVASNIGRFAKANAGGSSDYIIYTPTSGIPARSVNTPGSATCPLYTIDSDGNLFFTSMSQTVYNVFSDAIAANRWCVVSQVDGKLVVNSEDCPAATGPTNPS